MPMTCLGSEYHNCVAICWELDNKQRWAQLVVADWSKQLVALDFTG